MGLSEAESKANV